MISYPPFWTGGRWDVERLLADVYMFPANKSAEQFEGVKVEPFLTKNSDREGWLSQGNGWLLVHRRGGQYDRIAGVDKSICEIAALTRSRDESLELIAYAGDVLDGFGEDGGTVHRSRPHRTGLSTTFMKVPGEVVGPQLIPELTRDDRYVSTTWEIHADRPRGLPNYREALGLDEE
ncbi:hypothetical protein A5717_25985 [Mycolicibacterium porcinum]|uniref:phage tail termination protein n=1 Tax=Mycolicibacterium porcinum TaxID=39693 RepID=UPI00080B100A|nr:hypothetical protein [Mycolicibacterium porcinum]OCB09228.1 hypothetical protein A5717_25985 [Mycolicibacterium porcinum]